MSSHADQMNREIILPHLPVRIISIVPSQTELLFYLGLDEEIIGITKFCVHPKGKVKNKTKIGGTKQLNIELIRELQPDLIIANKEENERSQVEALMNICPVWISDINNLQEATNMIECTGRIVGRKNKADELINNINISFGNLNEKLHGLSVVYLIWRRPYMAAGRATFINTMLELCGLINALAVDRYPEVNDSMLRSVNPDVVMLSSEPYPFNHRHIKEIQAILPRAKIMLVDGEMFSWYGSRLIKAAAYFESIIKLLNESWL